MKLSNNPLRQTNDNEERDDADTDRHDQIKRGFDRSNDGVRLRLGIGAEHHEQHGEQREQGSFEPILNFH